jgi:hypothetical protein
MVQAIARVIGLSEGGGSIFLNFTETDIRRGQQRGVLVDVYLLDFKGSADRFTSRLTESSLNEQMLLLGLRSVKIVSKTENSNQGLAVGSSSSTNTTDGSENSSGASKIIIIIIGGVVGGLALIAVSACLVYWRRSNKREQSNVSLILFFVF